MRLYPIYFAWYTKQEYANCLRKLIYANTHLFLIIKRLCYFKLYLLNTKKT